MNKGGTYDCKTGLKTEKSLTTRQVPVKREHRFIELLNEMTSYATVKSSGDKIDQGHALF